MHGVERLDRVAQRFTLAGAAARAADVDHVGAEPLAGELERGAGARRGFVEDVDDGLASQIAELDDRLARHFQKLVRLLQQLVRQLGSQAVDRGQVGEPRGPRGEVLPQRGALGE